MDVFLGHSVYFRQSVLYDMSQNLKFVASAVPDIEGVPNPKVGNMTYYWPKPHFFCPHILYRYVILKLLDILVKFRDNSFMGYPEMHKALSIGLSLSYAVDNEGTVFNIPVWGEPLAYDYKISWQETRIIAGSNVFRYLEPIRRGSRGW